MKLLIVFLILLTQIFFGSVASADVADIDADIVANVTYTDLPGTDDAWIDQIDVSWTAMYSGYLYLIVYDNYDLSGQTVVNAMTGTPNDNINIGLIDDTGYGGRQIRAWRVGYVNNGSAYSIGGTVYEPGFDLCGSDGAAYQPVQLGGISYNGIYTSHLLSLTPGTTDSCSGLNSMTFLLIEAPPPESTLSGHVTNNIENSVSAATITLNNSGGSTNSNDTGYYEITGISSGTYSITATSPTHEDYSDTVSITSNTEKNITMTRLNPVLTYTDADTTENDVFLKWRRNIVVDNVRIYKDTETRLLTTVGSGSYLSGLYSDRNLDCDKGYVYWLQPMDGDVTGPKYRVDAKTDSCTDGGGGGTDPDPTPDPSPTVTPDPSPTVTPGPTVPPDINMTQEEWLNLTLEQKQEILTNLSLFPPLLEFKWEDVYVWGIHLFLILCGIIALDSITTQKISEYTGLWAILPGVMFAYLSGYLVI